MISHNTEIGNYFVVFNKCYYYYYYYFVYMYIYYF